VLIEAGPRLLPSCCNQRRFDFTLFSPILFALARDCRRFWVFDLHPICCAARAIGRAKPFADNALAAEATRLPIDIAQSSSKVSLSTMLRCEPHNKGE
jgi:hypothetical protein